MSFFSKKYIIDMTSFITGSNRGSVSFQSIIETLKRLNTLAKEENVDIIAVIEGRQRDDMFSKLSNIKIRYAFNRGQVYTLCDKLQNSFFLSRKKNVVITSDYQLERKILKQNGYTMRGATFKKILDISSHKGNEPQSRSVNIRHNRSSRDRDVAKRDSYKNSSNNSSSDVNKLVDLIE